jgi:hypothetical protein
MIAGLPPRPQVPFCHLGPLPPPCRLCPLMRRTHNPSTSLPSPCFGPSAPPLWPGPCSRDPRTRALAASFAIALRNSSATPRIGQDSQYGRLCIAPHELRVAPLANSSTGGSPRLFYSRHLILRGGAGSPLMLTITEGLVLKRANSFYKEIFLEFFSM